MQPEHLDNATVGVLGTGRMGTAMARRLLDQGVRVVVHNRTPQRAAGLLDVGAGWAATPDELARRVGVLLTSLYDDDAVRATYLGEDGLLTAVRPGTVLVDTSTVTAAASVELHARARALGAALVDAPVAGGPGQARDGQLLLMAGGEIDHLSAVEPVLARLGHTVVHLGAGGAGHVMKLVLMQSLATYFAGLSEAMTTGVRLGLQPQTMLQAVLASHAAPPALRGRAAQLVEEVAGRPGPVGFPVEGVLKDMRAELANADLAAAPNAVLTAAFATFTSAAEQGYAARDLISVVAATLAAAPPGPRARGRRGQEGDS